MENTPNTIWEINKQLQQILEADYIKGNKQPIYEFADLTPMDTNLNVAIWVHGPRNMPHSKRIKFQNNNSPKLNGGGNDTNDNLRRPTNSK